MGAKPTLAFFDFTGCEGCQIEFTNLGDDPTIELLKHVDLVEFREAMTETTTQRIDIALIEGSFTREMDRNRLMEIRRRAHGHFLRRMRQHGRHQRAAQSPGRLPRRGLRRSRRRPYDLLRPGTAHFQRHQS